MEKEEPELIARKMTLSEGSLIFSPNGAHYAYAGNQTYSGQNSKWALIVDGKMEIKAGRLEPFQKPSQGCGGVFTCPQLVFSPASQRLSYVMIPPSERGGRQHLMVGDQAYPPFNSYSFPRFSPDGKHFAVAAWSRKARKVVILVDGKEGPAYDRIVQPYAQPPRAVSYDDLERMVRANAAMFRFLSNKTLQFLAIKNGSIYRVTIEVGG